MIKLLLSLILIILVLIFFWKNVFLNEPKKVRFSEDVENLKCKTVKKTILVDAEPSSNREIIPPDNSPNTTPPNTPSSVSKPAQNSSVSQNNPSQGNTQLTQNGQENFEGPTYAQPNSRNVNMEKMNFVYNNNINPYNFYTQEYNTPNFNTDVLDVRQFFAYDVPPNSPERSIDVPKQPYFPSQKYPDNNQLIQFDRKITIPWDTKDRQTPSGMELESDSWVYKNEIPMNGGYFGNVVGYENAGDSFSQFYAKNTADIVEQQEAYIKKDDDLRTGMGTPQKQKYLYNMAMP